MGRPAGSTGFCRVIVLAGFLLNPNRSSHRVDPPGRAGFNNYASGDLLREHLITAIFGHLCHSYELKNMKMSMDWAGYF
jgi:hypothetical protein